MIGLCDRVFQNIISRPSIACAHFTLKVRFFFQCLPRTPSRPLWRTTKWSSNPRSDQVDPNPSGEQTTVSLKIAESTSVNIPVIYWLSKFQKNCPHVRELVNVNIKQWRLKDKPIKLLLSRLNRHSEAIEVEGCDRFIFILMLRYLIWRDEKSFKCWVWHFGARVQRKIAYFLALSCCHEFPTIFLPFHSIKSMLVFLVAKLRLV